MTMLIALSWIVGMVSYLGCVIGVSHQIRGNTDTRATVWLLVSSLVVIALWWVLVGRLLAAMTALTAALTFGGLVAAALALGALMPRARRTEDWPYHVSAGIALFLGLCCIAVPLLAVDFPSTCNIEDHLCFATRSSVIRDGLAFVAPPLLGWGLLSGAARKAIGLRPRRQPRV